MLSLHEDENVLGGGQLSETGTPTQTTKAASEMFLTFMDAVRTKRRDRHVLEEEGKTETTGARKDPETAKDPETGKDP